MKYSKWLEKSQNSVVVLLLLNIVTLLTACTGGSRITITPAPIQVQKVVASPQGLEQPSRSVAPSIPTEVRPAITPEAISPEDDTEGQSEVRIERQAPLMALGANFTLAVVEGIPYAWGRGFEGQLADGRSESSQTAIRLHRPEGDVIAVGAGGQHSCFATASGVWCSGLNSFGQLGVPRASRATRVNAPVQISSQDLPISGDIELALANESSYVLAKSEGNLWSFGRNNRGQLGDGTRLERSLPNRVIGLPGRVTQVSSRGQHVCAVSEGQAWCWGRNDQGQLGNFSGTREVNAVGDDADEDSIQNSRDSNMPVRVSGLEGVVVEVATGLTHSCARLQSGAVYCWGSNLYGQTGNGSEEVSFPLPVQVEGLGAGSGVQQIVAGSHHTCARMNGTLRCWGRNNYGQLGDDSAELRLVIINYLVLMNNVNRPTEVRRVPVLARGLQNGNVLSVAAGGSHTCAAIRGRGFKCFGYNAYGQLGDDSQENRFIPRPVLGILQDLILRD